MMSACVAREAPALPRAADKGFCHNKRVPAGRSFDVRHRSALLSIGVWCAWLSVAASADTLVLRDGRRVEGELIGFRDGMIEFDGQRRFGGR